ncbi:acyltransferase family protein [Undibacterium sp. Di27W]|uniref:acyltransferase family protein n=1 Tax=Undibacterium sp. Di27W TaxID=3413036 RepID=UPI003BF2EB46
MRLSACIASRDNNLNLFRIVAALAVLFGHSFALLAQPEPWGVLTGMTPGSVAVDVFFIVSGMLVTASLMSRQSVIDYVCARVLRIFPALTVMLLLTVFVLGPCFTSLSLYDYFSTAKTWQYLLKCGSLLFGMAYKLPGVFAHNPYPDAVNGSLWTMPNEIKMYLLLLVFWCGLAFSQKKRLQILKYLLPALTLLAGVLVFVRHFYLHDDSQFTRLLFMFFSGASLFVLKEKLVLARLFFYPLLALVLLAAFIDKSVFFTIYTLAIAYLVVCFAYLPAGWIRRYNALGDYSYGVYIYAFPVQQAIAALFPGIAVWSMVLVSAFVTMSLAIFSWHRIEKPALALKSATVMRLQAYLPRLLPRRTPGYSAVVACTHCGAATSCACRS